MEYYDFICLERILGLRINQQQFYAVLHQLTNKADMIRLIQLKLIIFLPP